ncbi:reverse transcriptase family protein [Vibrio algarum]|uniref:RNA-directed DNA polymerase n=1 Tax=Vibrio algarum TaxID=3020714 RepID=A0ABT4YPB2_9VIBR|nr:reverse transcriptase family protein [Vibrio sp. KJ40-1]MDB1123398.1 reverse transcriptase family protein [Vibrio sp. KJ40-1]
MKKYSLSSIILDLLKEYKYYTDGGGVAPLPSSSIRELKIGKKFAYSLAGDIKDVHTHISKVIFKQYLSKIPINQSAKAYIVGKSYYDFLEPHRNNYFFLRLDLKNFFHSIKSEVVMDNLLDYFSSEKISENCEQSHASAIYNLIMYKIDSTSNNSVFSDKEVLPMGFPLSPHVSNIVFRKIDLLIEKFCDIHNVTYTRYADDMLFSSKGKVLPRPIFRPLNGTKLQTHESPFLHSNRFYDEISFLVGLDGYKINDSKIKKAVHTISLNGYTIVGSNYSDIKGELKLSNKKTKIIRKLIYELNSNKHDTAIFKKCFKKDMFKPRYQEGAREFLDEFCTNQINNKLLGYKSYILSIVKYDSDRDCCNTETTEKFQSLLVELDACIDKRIG